MNEYMRTLERMVLKTIADEADIPKDIIKMMDIFVECGCPLGVVMKAMSKFGEYLAEDSKAKEERDALKELLKDLPIKFEEE